MEGNKRVTFLYDYMGRRVKKKVEVFGTGVWQPDKEMLFVYDGWNLIKESTTLSGQAATDKYYVWGLDLSDSLQGAGGVGGLLVTVDNGKAYYYCYDANGNVGQLIDSSDGTVAAHYQYYPFGGLRRAEGVYWEENGFRFSTKYFDTDKNLYYYGYRYYSAELGRWISRDPLEELGSELTRNEFFSFGINSNPYLFVQNNAVNLYDLFGLIWIKREGKRVWVSGQEYSSIRLRELNELRERNRMRRQERRREHQKAAAEYLAELARNNGWGIHDPTKPWGFVEAYDALHDVMGTGRLFKF
jgi:RHS repeat-associated protein